MIINFSPIVSNRPLSLSVSGDMLTVNDESFDFSSVPDGATLPSSAITSDYIIGNIDRVDGEIELTVLLPISSNSSNAAKFPQAITQSTGQVELPS